MQNHQPTDSSKTRLGSDEEAPQVGLWNLFWRLPGTQQLALLGVFSTVFAAGVCLAYVIRAAQVEKVEVEKAGIQNNLDALRQENEKLKMAKDDSKKVRAQRLAPVYTDPLWHMQVDNDVPSIEVARRDSRSLYELHSELEKRDKGGTYPNPAPFNSNPDRWTTFQLRDEGKTLPLNRALKGSIQSLVNETIAKRFKWTVRVDDVISVSGGNFIMVQGLFENPPNPDLRYSFGLTWYFDTSSHGASLATVRQGDQITAEGVMNRYAELVNCRLLEVVPQKNP